MNVKIKDILGIVLLTDFVMIKTLHLPNVRKIINLKIILVSLMKKLKINAKKIIILGLSKTLNVLIQNF